MNMLFFWEGNFVSVSAGMQLLSEYVSRVRTIGLFTGYNFASLSLSVSSV